MLRKTATRDARNSDMGMLDLPVNSGPTEKSNAVLVGRKDNKGFGKDLGSLV